MYIDDNGYRYYHVLQYDTFLTIRQLHMAGMSLKSIKLFMKDRTPESIVELYKKMENDLEHKISELTFIDSQRDLYLLRMSKHTGKRVWSGLRDNPTKKLNCWETVKLCKLQRRDEMLKRECCENRKNYTDDIRLNPKYCKIGNQQPRPEQGKVQRLFLLREVHHKRLVMEVVSPKWPVP